MAQTDDKIEILFKEKQKTDSIWPLSIMAFVLAVNWWLYFRNGLTDMSFFYICMVLVGILSLFLGILRLDTEITTQAIRYRLYPFSSSWKVISIQQIKTADIRTYRPFKEFGGRGNRSKRLHRAVTIAGNQGLQLSFKSDKQLPLLLGTQKPLELAETLSQLKLS
ncbi:MAG: hypothetical protein LC107_01105 [Chitinophagales bacterium]|nr:hypothetical protein [Chitinophagales bacterium]